MNMDEELTVACELQSGYKRKRPTVFVTPKDELVEVRGILGQDTSTSKDLCQRLQERVQHLEEVMVVNMDLFTPADI